MKISKKLQSYISLAIEEKINDYLFKLDSLDRTEIITHEAWQKTHKPACELSSNIKSAVLNEIEKY